MSHSAPSPAKWDLDAIVNDLRNTREQWRHKRKRDLAAHEFPSRETIKEVTLQLRGALFPLRLGPADLKREGEDFYIGHALDSALNTLVTQIQLELTSRLRSEEVSADSNATSWQASEIVAAFGKSLPAIRALLDTDVEAAYRGDPAARSVDEVLLCYPGILALINHRLANKLHKLGAPLIARIIAELAHSETGIDIHPGASIGRSFFIDHGTGVVIGETATIGDRVRIYQAVTLGAKRFETEADGALQKGLPRHPVVEDDVVIYAGATILGRVTIGRGATIGGNVWVTRNVPAGGQVTQARSRDEASEPKSNGAPE